MTLVSMLTNAKTRTVALSCLLLVHAALLAHTAWRKSATVDEVAHLPAGITYWEKRTFAVYHHNPPLVKLLAALPVMAAGGQVDYTRSWERNRSRGLPVSQWNLGWDFMYANAPRYRFLFFLGRLVPIGFSCAGLVLMARLARHIAGDRAVLPAACLWCFSPNLLAHGCLVTTDGAATVMTMATLLCLFHWASALRLRRTALLGVVLGLAQLTKFSLLLLYPLALLVGLLLATGKRTKLILHYVLAMLVSVFVINAGYFFEGTCRPLGEYTFLSDLLTRPRATAPQPGEIPPDHPWAYVMETRVNRFRGGLLHWLPVPLPEHYVAGFDEQRLEAEGIPGPDGRRHGYYVYLAGQLRDHGWWYYYLVALALKLPLGTIFLVLLWTVLVLVGRLRPHRLQLAAIVLATAFLGAMSLATDINLGLRYVLPVVPLSLLATVSLFAGSVRWIRALAVVALAWNAICVGRIHPHYLAYFNELAGGPARGHQYLIDSNIDWGQDLYELAEWLEEHYPNRKIGLAYFGNVDPAILPQLGYAVKYYLAPPRSPDDLSLAAVAPDAPLRGFLLEWAARHGDLLSEWQSRYPGRPPFDLPELKRAIFDHLGIPPPSTPGVYAVSVNFLRRLPFRIRDQQSNIWDFARFDDGSRGDPYSYFLKYTPVARIGYSIYVFEIR